MTDNFAVDFLRHGFELRSKLGSGTMGNVYLVFSQRYNLFFAAKQILKNRHAPITDDETTIPLSKSRKTNFQSDTFHNLSPLAQSSTEEHLFENPNFKNDSQDQNAQIKLDYNTNTSLSKISIQQILNADENIISEESKNEIKSLMMLDHPNIVKIYEVFEEGDYLYIILEYCENNSLKDFISLKEGKRLQGKELFNFVLQMTLAVQYCHSMRIVHRDIKPANFLLDHYYRLKLADFGLSMTNVSTDPNNEVKVCGSPAYMSPELLIYRKGRSIAKSSTNFFSIIDKEEPSFNGPIDLYKADIWALGINIYEIAVGKKPFVGTIDQIRKQVMHSFEKPNEIEDTTLIKLLRGMLQINSSARYNMEQILSSEYFIKNGFTDSQSTINSSRVQIALGKSHLSSSTPLSVITPPLSNTKSYVFNHFNTRCTNSTSSFFIKRPTKNTRNKNRQQTSNLPNITLNFYPIKSSRPQSIIAPQIVNTNVQFMKPNSLSYQETIYNQFADAQKITSLDDSPNTDINALQIPTLKNHSNKTQHFSNSDQKDTHYDNDLSNSNSNSSMGSRESEQNQQDTSSIKMKDVFVGIGSGRLLTSNSISKGNKNSQTFKATQPTFIQNK